jgi:hypothetical protein
MCKKLPLTNIENAGSNWSQTHIITRKYMHACRNPRLADKTIVFSEHEVSKVVVMVTR